MSEQGMYGYATDNVEFKPSAFVFGLNAGKCFLTKFGWIPNGGADGAEQEALDIVFTINGEEKSYRKFPVTKAYDKNQNEVTDPNSAEMKDAIMNFNSTITHILHTFVDEATIKAAFGRPISSFKQFCEVAKGLLPDPRQIPLDIFLQYQWKIGKNAKRTYLEIPTKMKQGKWLCKAVPGDWEEVKIIDAGDDVTKALYYRDKNNHEIEHPFVKNGWFLNSNAAKLQKIEGGDNNTSGYQPGVSENKPADVANVADVPAATASNSAAAW